MPTGDTSRSDPNVRAGRASARLPREPATAKNTTRTLNKCPRCPGSILPQYTHFTLYLIRHLVCHQCAREYGQVRIPKPPPIQGILQTLTPRRSRP